jgi:hypothetical protein
LRRLACWTATDGDALGGSGDGGPANGTLTLKSQRALSNTPHAEFRGSDTFTHTAFYNSTGSNVATVAITINPVNEGAGD